MGWLAESCCKWIFNREYIENEEVYYLVIAPDDGDESYEKFTLVINRREKELLNKSPDFFHLIRGKTVEQARDICYDYLGRETYCMKTLFHKN